MVLMKVLGRQSSQVWRCNMQGVLYADSAETINLSKWPVLVPDEWEPFAPQLHIDNTDLQPLYFNTDIMCKSSLSINEMIPLLINGVPFELCSRTDALMIHDILADYTTKMSEHVNGFDAHTPEAVYLRNAITFHRALHGYVVNAREKVAIETGVPVGGFLTSLAKLFAV